MARRAAMRVILALCLAGLGVSGGTQGEPAIGAVAIPACDGGEALNVGCHAARYELLTQTQGATAALADLAGRRDENGLILAACHQLVHVIGRSAGAARGMDALADRTPLCSFGYDHGVVEGVMAQ